MQTNCLNCKFWQGNKYDKWADCFRVIEILEPRLLAFTSRFGDKFMTPFDPHDVKYFVHDPGFYKVYKKLSRTKLCDGVRLHNVKGRRDVVFNNQTGAFGECKVVPLYYYQTKPTFTCPIGECDDSHSTSC